MKFILSLLVLLNTLPDAQQKSIKDEIMEKTMMWKKCMAAERFNKCFLHVFDDETVMLANGHKPTIGRKDTAKWYQEIEEWGPGLEISIKGQEMAKSKDLFLIYGEGHYLHMDEMSFIVVWENKDKKEGWRAHMVVFHMWPKEEEKPEAKVASNFKSGSKPTGAETTDELLKSWPELIKTGNIEKLNSFYSEDCVIFDNMRMPVVGRENVAKIFQKFYEFYKQEEYGVKSMEQKRGGFEVSKANDLAIAYGTWGISDKVRGNYMFLLKKINGKWLIHYQSIAHETAV